MAEFPVCSKLPVNSEQVILGEKYRDLLEKALSDNGISCVFVPDNPDVDRRLSGHADLSVFYPGGERIYLSPYLKGGIFAHKISKSGLNIEFPEIIQREKYPFDAQMNICSLPEYYIFNPKVSCPDIVSYLTNLGVTGIPVKQGYCGCCVCVTGERSIISSDPGIASACEKLGFDVLLIKNGYIELPGFEYGFIGGSAFIAERKKLAFTGKLDLHPDKDKIINFLREKEIEPVFLTEKPIFDVGSIIPIREKLV